MGIWNWFIYFWPETGNSHSKTSFCEPVIYSAYPGDAISYRINYLFAIEIEQNNKMLFLYVEIRELSKFTTVVCRRPIFKGVSTHFDNLLPSTREIKMIQLLLNRSFHTCFDWSKFH